MQRYTNKYTDWHRRSHTTLAPTRAGVVRSRPCHDDDDYTGTNVTVAVPDGLPAAPVVDGGRHLAAAILPFMCI